MSLTWSTVGNINDTKLQNIATSTTGRYVLVIGTTKLHTSSDYGETFVGHSISPYTFDIGLCAVSPDGVFQYACVKNNSVFGLYYSNTSGQTWQYKALPTIMNVESILTLTCWTDYLLLGITQPGSETTCSLWRSSDNGDTWVQVLIINDNISVFSTVAAVENYVIIGTVNGKIFYNNASATAGSTFVDISPINDRVYSVAVDQTGEHIIAAVQVDSAAKLFYRNQSQWSEVYTYTPYPDSGSLNCAMSKDRNIQTIVGLSNYELSYPVSSVNQGPWTLGIVNPITKLGLLAMSSNGNYQYTLQFEEPYRVYRSVNGAIPESYTLTLTIYGAGSVVINGITYTGPETGHGTSIITGLEGTVTVSAVDTQGGRWAFSRWEGDGVTTEREIEISEEGALIAYFVSAPLVTQRKYWPSSSELTSNNKPCRCNCFKPAQQYTSYADRDRAIRFGAAGCNCCKN